MSQSIKEELIQTLDRLSLDKQLPLNSRRNSLPVKCINGTLLMGHEYLARALVELRQIGKTPSRSNAVLPHAPEAFDGVEVVPTMGR